MFVPIGKRISLGEFSAQGNFSREKLPRTRTELLRRVREYCVDKLQYTPKNVKGTMSGVQYLVDHYGVGGRPLSVEDGESIRKDLLAKGLSPRTVILKLFYYELMAEALGYVDERGDPIYILKPKKVKPVSDYFTIEERDKMLGKVGNARDLAILWVGFCGGPRPDELCNIWVSDVEFSKREIVIRDHGQGLKTFEERPIRMNDATIEAVRAWLEVRPLVESRCLFLNEYGGKLSPWRLNVGVVKPIAAAAGIERRVYTYMLRHSCATHILENGGSPADVALQLGDSIETVVRHYLHKNYQSLDRVVRRL